MNTKAIIEELGNHLEAGQSTRVICPRCGGGSSEELSLSITRSEEGPLLWYCFRASCDEGGNTHASGKPLATKQRRAMFTGNVRELSTEQRMRIRDLWQMDPHEDWFWTPEKSGRVAMSIRSPKFTHRGWVLRDITGKLPIKALTFLNEGEEGISWYKTHPQKPTVIVEDMPSAVRASAYVNSVALLGTNISLSRAEEIASYAPRPILVALDQDATAQAFAIARRWSLLWGDVRVLPLHQDIKNMPEKAIQELLA